MSWERNLIRLYMRSLDEQTEWVFKIQTTLLMVASTTFAVIISLSSPSEDSLCNKVLLVTAICVMHSVSFSLEYLYARIEC